MPSPTGKHRERRQVDTDDMQGQDHRQAQRPDAQQLAEQHASGGGQIRQPFQPPIEPAGGNVAHRQENDDNNRRLDHAQHGQAHGADRHRHPVEDMKRRRPQAEDPEPGRGDEDNGDEPRPEGRRDQRGREPNADPGDDEADCRLNRRRRHIRFAQCHQCKP